MTDDWAEELQEGLGEIFCLTFVEGVDEAEALRRFGGLPDTLRPRTPADLHAEAMSFDAGYPRVAAALRVDGWTVVLEPEGFEGVEPSLLGGVSRGTRAVAVLRHDYAASHDVAYAEDGTVLASLDPDAPGLPRVAPPERLLPAMRAAGLDPDAEYGEVDGVGAALRFARLVTGVTLSAEMFDGPLPSAAIEPWFVGVHDGDLLAPSHDAELYAAVQAATPAARWAVASSELQRLAGACGAAADAPMLAAAVSAVTRGEDPGVTSDSPLGLRVRDWLADSRRASNVGAIPTDRWRLQGADLSRALMAGWLAAAVRQALSPDSRTAALGALRPLAAYPGPPLRDPARRTAVLSALASPPR